MLPTEASIGDIVVLTHMMAISRHARLDVPCQVVNVRHYEAPNGAFKYTGIVCTTHELLEQTYMVMIRTSGNDKDYRLYRMDGMHAAKDVGEFILDDQKQNIKDEFMVFVEDPTTSEEIPVVWKSDSLGNIHGVKYKDSNVRSIVTLCSYDTPMLNVAIINVRQPSGWEQQINVVLLPKSSDSSPTDKQLDDAAWAICALMHDADRQYQALKDSGGAVCKLWPSILYDLAELCPKLPQFWRL